MSDSQQVELFLLKCASLNEHFGSAHDRNTSVKDAENDVVALGGMLDQFSSAVRINAIRMAEYYKLFYMLENDIRKLIDDTLVESYGNAWWQDHAPQSAKDECLKTQQREQEAGFSSRSESELDYISFGQLGEIIRSHWTLFGGILSNPKALGRVMYPLNNLRGPIAHCGLLAEDEIDRLRLTVKDWFRLLEGPK
jgi:hypothetical protein